jgi:mannose-1-phosphate guanylyltransferase
VAPERIFTIANAPQTDLIRKIVKGLPRRNFLVEPLARNTAPSLMLATAHAYIEDPATVVAALAADHLIGKPDVFLRKLEAAAAAAARGNAIVTFGVRPTFPSTGYGYIHYAKDKAKTFRREPFYPALEFREKPNLEDARRYLASGDYAWNSGMFLWRAEVFAAKLKKFAPEFFPFWERMVEALKKKNTRSLRAVFEEIPAISIDYALMEKAEGVLVSEGDFGWSDVGAWSALYDVWPLNENGCAIKGEAVAIETRGCLVHNPKKLTALIGVENLVVIDTDDVLLICRRDLDQKVKDVVEILKKKKSDRW